MLTALGKCDVERRRCFDGVVEEQLEEIAEAEEQQAVLMLCLEREILRHQGRCGFLGR